MVHALEQIHQLLTPGGVLIDIHNAPEPPLFEVRRYDALLYSEPQPGYCGDPYLEPQKALNEVVRRRLFALEGTRRIDFFILADSVAELRAFQAEFYAYAGTSEPSEERQQLDVRLQKALEKAGPGARVATHEIGIASGLSAINR